MMAVVNPAWNYWLLQFWAQVLAPFSVDVLFSVGLVIVSDQFPEKTQGGSWRGVRHGQSSWPGFAGVDDAVLLKGYQASFWIMFAYMIVCGLVATVGLRKTGKFSLKCE